MACLQRLENEIRACCPLCGEEGHFARLRCQGLRLRWKRLWIQQPRLFRLLVAFNDRLPHALRFVRNPTVTLR